MVQSIRTELKMVSRPTTEARHARAATAGGFRVLESGDGTRSVKDASKLSPDYRRVLRRDRG
jgi:hypothetical protein